MNLYGMIISCCLVQKTIEFYTYKKEKSKKMSDLNKIIAFNQIMPYLSQEDQNKLAHTMGMDIEEVQRRLTGKNKEDEFVLILLLMDVCKNISGFDEGLSQLLKTATSDLLIELKNDKKFMIEIKHTYNDKFSISNGNLRKRIDYAKALGFDLYFAISIKGIWMLFDSDYLIEKRGKIDVSDMIKSKLDDILECNSYIFPKGLRIQSIYSKDYKKSIDVQFEPYGKLVSYTMYNGNKKIFRIKGQKSNHLGFSMILEALQDRLSMDTQTIIQDGEFTIINESFSSDYNMISEYKFLLAPIEHLIDSNCEKYTAHTYIENVKTDSSLLKCKTSKEHVRATIQFLVDQGVDIKYVKNNLIYKLNTQK